MLARSILLLAALAACSRSGQAPEKVQESATPAPETPSTPAEKPARPFAFAEERDGLDFSYSYPVEAARIPHLAALFQADLKRQQARAAGYASHDRRSATADGRPFNGHYFAKAWKVEGQSPALLSLTALTETFTGGAHGNARFDGLLWDSAARAAVPAATLLPVGAKDAVRKRYCEALDAERSERREGEVIEGQYSQCPDVAELVIAPADEDGDGRFEQLRFLAAPYVAGPYAEGAYSIDVPLSADAVAAIQPRYRQSFAQFRQ